MDSLLKIYKCRLLKPILWDVSSVRTLKMKKSVRQLLGLPPYLAKSLDQKLTEANYKDPAIHFKVNIGLPQIIKSRSDTIQEKIAYYKKIKKDFELEKKARDNKISLCLEEVAAEWIHESAPQHIKEAAEYYGIFQDLFGDAFFYPQIRLDVNFKHNQSLIPVYRGNCVKPNQAGSAPLVSYEAEEDSLWSLIVTNPDGHLDQENAEYLHWFLGNIPGSDLSQGEVVASYIQPFPARGTGFQRFVFILYKQTKKINFSSLEFKEVNLKNRTFKTYDFYQSYQDQLTPAGLAFCQVDWDDSVSQFFHTVLDMEEPVFEYDFEPPYHPKQKMYPIRQPFNLYMDRYRDPKQIAKEYLLKKLKDRNPFENPKPPLRFPNAVPIRHDLDEILYGKVPSWLKREKLKQRLGHGRINDY